MIRFLVFSDLHYDEVTDGDNRIEKILADALKRDLDFIVSLGDLCTPIKENQRVLERFKSLGIPFYNVIGNHETDKCILSEILDFYAINNPYYSVICNGYKLIFLNTCYLVMLIERIVARSVNGRTGASRQTVSTDLLLTCLQIH